MKVITLLILLTIAAAQQTLTVGGLFPLTGSLGSVGPDRRDAALIAVQNINNRSDILPNFILDMQVIDTGTNSQITLVGALNFLQNTTGNSTRVGFIGASSSAVSATAQLVASTFNVPQISYSSTDPGLSDNAAFPTFSRVVPPDNFQSQALAALVVEFGWRAVATLATTDTYGSSGIQAFSSEAVNLEIQILSSQSFNRDATDVSAQVRALANSGARIFILFVLAGDAQTVLREADRQGLIGPDYVWITPDGPSQDATFLVNGNVDTTLVNLFQGGLGTRPSGGTGPLFEQFLDQWQVFNGGDRTINFFGPYAYDSMWAMALALHNRLEVQQLPFDGLAVFDEIGNLDFTGLTGRVTFNEFHDREGIYEIVNVQGPEFIVLGTWSPQNGLMLNSGAIFFDGTTNIPSDGTSSGGDGKAAVVTVGVVLGVFVFCLLIVFPICFIYIWKRRSKRRFAALSTVYTELSLSTKVYLTEVEIGEKLGGGQYGNVFKGQWKGSTIAAKQILDNDYKAIENEVNILTESKHPYIVTYLGLFTPSNQEFFIITEFCSGGDLLSWLHSTSDTSGPLLTDLARQIASGMEYLHSQTPQIIHRDLAARNVLLTGDRTHPTCKVSDFGLSNHVGDDLDENAHIPVRWSPPESLNEGTFGPKTDVWSFGVLCWEIYSLGEVPYKEITKNRPLIKFVTSGNKLTKPRFVSSEVWEIVEQCYAFDPNDRPSMQDLRKSLSKHTSLATPTFGSKVASVDSGGRSEPPPQYASATPPSVTPSNPSEMPSYSHFSPQPSLAAPKTTRTSDSSDDDLESGTYGQIQQTPKQTWASPKKDEGYKPPSTYHLMPIQVNSELVKYKNTKN